MYSNSNDEVIPPSPVVNKKYRKRRNSSKKRKQTITSLNSKQKLDSRNETSNSITLSEIHISSNDGVLEENVTNVSNTLNPLYSGLEEYVESETPVRNKFDMLARAKLLENGNQNDIKQMENIKINRIHSIGLTSLKELIESQRLVIDEPIDEDIPHHLMEDNLIFSEWPVCQEHNVTNSQERLNAFTQREIDATPSSSSRQLEESSIADSIVSDFNCDDLSFQEDTERKLELPWNKTRMKKNLKTYSHRLSSTNKKLIFSESWEFNGNEAMNDDNIKLDEECCSEDLDIDVDPNDRAIENICSLSSFFTQTQNFKLDFSTNLSESITNCDEHENNISINDDDEQINYTQDNNEISKSQQSNNDLSHFYKKDEEDLMLHSVETPYTKHKQSMKRKLDASTPIFAKATTHINHATPSTSKDSFELEQRDTLMPKRLRFDQDFNNETRQNDGFNAKILETSSTTARMGFITAKGNAINQSSSKAMKRTRDIFANIDNEIKTLFQAANQTTTKHDNSKNLSDFRPLDMENDAVNNKFGESSKCHEPIVFKRANGSKCKMSDSVMRKAKNLFANIDTDAEKLFQAANQTTAATKKHENSKNISDFHPLELENDAVNNEFGENSKCHEPIGFKWAHGSKYKMSDSVMTKAKNIFGENFDDIRSNQTFGTSNLQTHRFSKASTSSNHQQKINEEIDRSNQNDLTSSDIDSVCQTPVAKIAQRSQIFATSTPNQSDFNHSNTNLPPITPINKNQSNMGQILQTLGMNDINELSHLFDQEQDYTSPSQMKNDRSETLNLMEESSIIASENDVLKIDEKIKTERKRMLSQQQADCMRKSTINQTPGALYLKKLLEKKTSLSELNPPKKYSSQELQNFGLQMNVIEVNIENVKKFKFDMWNYYSNETCCTNVNGIEISDEMNLILDENSRVGFNEITNAFLHCPSVDPKLIPDHWITNSIKWIIIKLAGMERSYPHENANKCLTPENVLLQLKFRYDREVYKAERPAIRKILEQDDTAAKRMVLFVSRISQNGLEYAMELCDGWYAIRTMTLDAVLTKAIRAKKIVIGTKLLIQGAELHGCEEACHPLEVISNENSTFIENQC